MAKKNKKEKKKSPQKEETKSKPLITMQDLEEISGDELPPEDEWDEETKALKEAILGGAYDHLLQREDGGVEEDDDESIEEIEVRSTDDENEGHDSEDEEIDNEEADENEAIENEEDSKASEEASDSENEEQSEEENDDKKETKADGSEDEGSEEDDDSENDDDDDEEQEEEDESEMVDSSKGHQHPNGSKALHIVTQQLIAEKAGWPWPETFAVVSQTPLPFNVEGEDRVDIHDDLKREVAFYDMALESVFKAREQCKKAGVPITRPADFFAEMVKSDEHMARVKDRLIFETKKIDAVNQRKSNKEHKLRSKEAHANKIAEKAKRKKDHFKAVEDWTNSAERGQDNRLMEALDGKKGPNKKRQLADKKYGFGGKRPRFKQNDPKSMNDMSGYNPRGNFSGGMKKTSKSSNAGAGRKGKRARDASRSRQRN